MQTFDLVSQSLKYTDIEWMEMGGMRRCLYINLTLHCTSYPLLGLPVQACVRMRGNALRQVTFLLFFLLFSGCDCNIRLFTNLWLRYYGMLDGCIEVALGCLPLPNKGRNWQGLWRGIVKPSIGCWLATLVPCAPFPYRKYLEYRSGPV